MISVGEYIKIDQRARAIEDIPVPVELLDYAKGCLSRDGLMRLVVNIYRYGFKNGAESEVEQHD